MIKVDWSNPQDGQALVFNSETNTYSPSNVGEGVPGLNGADYNEFTFSSSLSGFVGSGLFRFDSNVYEEISSAYISKTDVNGIDVSGWLGSISDSDVDRKGIITFRDQYDKTKYASFFINGVESLGSSYAVYTEYIESNGEFIDGETVVISLSRFFIPDEDDARSEFYSELNTSGSDSRSQTINDNSVSIGPSSYSKYEGSVSLSGHIWEFSATPAKMSEEIIFGERDVSGGTLNVFILPLVFFKGELFYFNYAMFDIHLVVRSNTSGTIEVATYKISGSIKRVSGVYTFLLTPVTQFLGESENFTPTMSIDGNNLKLSVVKSGATTMSSYYIIKLYPVWGI